MHYVLDGNRISNFNEFLKVLESTVSGKSSTEVDVGWDLHSLNDRLHGGYGMETPVEIIVESGEVAIEAFGYGGLVEYCEWMVAVIKGGGKGLNQEDAFPFFERTREAALNSEGDTLLDMLLEVFDVSRTGITFMSCTGEVLATSKPNVVRK